MQGVQLVFMQQVSRRPDSSTTTQVSSCSSTSVNPDRSELRGFLLQASSQWDVYQATILLVALPTFRLELEPGAFHSAWSDNTVWSDIAVRTGAT